MSIDEQRELYQQVIIEHSKKPRNYKILDPCTNSSEGYNPLCGDHLHVYLNINDKNVIDEITFEGDGCAISKASASMMTQCLKGKTLEEAKELFNQFHNLIVGKLDPKKEDNKLGKLAIFSGIWHFPSRVKCASLCWHTMKGAIDQKDTISTE